MKFWIKVAAVVIAIIVLWVLIFKGDMKEIENHKANCEGKLILVATDGTFNYYKCEECGEQIRVNTFLFDEVN